MICINSVIVEMNKIRLRNTNGDCRLIKKIPDVRPLEEDLPD